MATTPGPIRNWAGTVTYTPTELHRPTSVAELQQLVAGQPRVKALGTGHSFNRVADTDGALVSVRDLPPVLELDTAGEQLRVGAGIRYGELGGYLDERGRALPNLGSLPHISVGGACATGTHGSGDANQVLAAAVTALQLVTADGELVELAADDPDFAGCVIGLGALGVVTALTLRTVPAFQLRQYVYDGLPLDALAGHLDEVFGAGYSVSAFTRWQDGLAQVWVKSRDERPGGDWFGAVPADGPRHPIAGEDPVAATEQLGVEGAWRHRLPHFRLEFTPSAGEEIQSEYFVPREHAPAVIGELRAIAELLAPALLVSELRTIAADELWLSPAYGQPRVAFHFTWRRDEPLVGGLLPELESRLAPYGAVPHWGKRFDTPPARLAELHPRLADFAALAGRYDPTGKFGNDFSRQLLEQF